MFDIPIYNSHIYVNICLNEYYRGVTLLFAGRRVFIRLKTSSRTRTSTNSLTLTLSLSFSSLYSYTKNLQVLRPVDAELDVVGVDARFVVRASDGISVLGHANLTVHVRIGRDGRFDVVRGVRQHRHGVGRVALGVVHRLQLDVDVAVVVVRSHLGIVGQDVVRNIRGDGVVIDDFLQRQRKGDRADVRVDRLPVSQVVGVASLDQVQGDVAELVDVRRHRNSRRLLVQRQVRDNLHRLIQDGHVLRDGNFPVARDVGRLRRQIRRGDVVREVLVQVRARHPSRGQVQRNSTGTVADVLGDVDVQLLLGDRAVASEDNLFVVKKRE
jgi:hypothetical protein